jgi:hypothetical protein
MKSRIILAALSLALGALIRSRNVRAAVAGGP